MTNDTTLDKPRTGVILLKNGRTIFKVKGKLKELHYMKFAKGSKIKITLISKVYYNSLKTKHNE